MDEASRVSGRNTIATQGEVGAAVDGSLQAWHNFEKDPEPLRGIWSKQQTSSPSWSASASQNNHLTINPDSAHRIYDKPRNRGDTADIRAEPSSH